MELSLPAGTILHSAGTNREYEILKPMGGGGFGLTYLCERKQYNEALGELKQVVIKELFFKNHCSRDDASGSVIVSTDKETFQSLKKALLREASLQHKLQHEYIVKVHDVFEANNTAYSVMEYIEGTSLEMLIAEKKKIAYPQVLRYARQIGEGLGCIHAEKIIHCDIKPGNVLIDHNNNVKIIDFGLSKKYGDKGTVEESRLLIGESGMYTAPEVYGRGTITFQPRVDIYSLGVTSYYSLTGENIQNGPTRADMRDAALKLTGENAKYKEFEALLNKCCKPKSEERYQDADEFLFALSKIDKIPYQRKKQPEPIIDDGALLRSPKGHIIFYVCFLLMSAFMIWYLHTTRGISTYHTAVITKLPDDEHTKERAGKLDTAGFNAFINKASAIVTSYEDRERLDLMQQNFYREELLTALSPTELDTLRDFLKNPPTIGDTVWLFTEPSKTSINNLYTKTKAIVKQNGSHKEECIQFINKIDELRKLKKE